MINSEKNFVLLNKTKDMVAYSLTITSSGDRFPKRYRFTLVNRIQDTALSVYENILHANEMRLDSDEYTDRQRYQLEAIISCKMMLYFVELSYERKFINTNTCEHWAKMIIEIRRMLAAWRKADQKRVPPLGKSL